MVYTSSNQAAAILPSNTAIGTAVVTVTYGSQSEPLVSTADVLVTSGSPGLFTVNSRGTGPGSITSPAGALISYANSARPGEVVTAWGTGLGPIATPDNVLPTDFPNFPGVEVWVGGQPAQVAYAGRSGCCAAVDQISFTVPAAAGCNVPVTIVVGNASSNTVSLPVNGAGAACANTGPALPTEALTNAVAGTALSVAAIGIGPASLGIGNGTARLQALARRLSAELRVRVSVSDTQMLVRAYRSGDRRAIRAAIAKYAPQWKALDPRAKARVVAQLGQTEEGAIAFFGRLSSEGTAAAIGGALFPVAGSCVVLPSGVPSALGSMSTGLDAGTTLLLSGAPGALTMKQKPRGEYSVLLGASFTGPNVPSGAYTVRGTGGKDIGPFNVTITIGGPLTISNKPALSTIDPSQGATVTWTGGAAGNYVLIGGYSPNLQTSGFVLMPNSNFTCAEDAGKGAFTIPSYILSSMNATASGKGILWIAHHPLSNPISIPGVDLAYFADGSTDSVNVTFK